MIEGGLGGQLAGIGRAAGRLPEAAVGTQKRVQRGGQAGPLPVRYALPETPGHQVGGLLHEVHVLPFLAHVRHPVPQLIFRYGHL